jgi:uncharacterized protein YukE
MANVWGLDVEAVRTLGAQLDREAETIETLLKNLSTTLLNTPWSGPDSVQFRNAWDQQHSTQLRNVAQALRDTAGLARQNAQEQENISR